MLRIEEKEVIEVIGAIEVLEVTDVKEEVEVIDVKEIIDVTCYIGNRRNR